MVGVAEAISQNSDHCSTTPARNEWGLPVPKSHVV